MAKWGEGDPRWIVEERPDAINVNNWHWTEKDASTWSREKFDTLFVGMKIEQPGLATVEIECLGTVQGEACINNRKAKLIYIWDWDFELKWRGNLSGQDQVVSGIIRIPNLSDENDLDEIDVRVVVNEDDRKDHPEISERIADMIRKHAAPLIRDKCGAYIKFLKEEFSEGLLLPTKS